MWVQLHNRALNPFEFGQLAHALKRPNAKYSIRTYLNHVGSMEAGDFTVNYLITMSYIYIAGK